MSEFLSHMGEEKHSPYPLLTLLLAGGRGYRLTPITQGLIPKCFVNIDTKNQVRGIDFLDAVFKKLALSNVVFSADHYYQQYEEFVSKTKYSMLFQRPGGTAGAIEQAIEHYGLELQYLVISPDTFFSSQDLAKLILAHKPGQISWGVSMDVTQMETYYGLIVENGSNSVIGDNKLGRWKGLEYPDSTKYVKGAINMIDPVIFMKSLSLYKRFCKKGYPIDFYWDFLPFFEEYNFRKQERGFDSQLTAVVFENPIIDFGTPERLKYLKKVYKNP